MGNVRKTGLFGKWRASVFIILWFITTLGSAARSPARSETQDPITDVIYVTAQKRVQRIQDVPISITAMSGEFLEQNRVENLIGVAPLTPGLQAHSPALQSSIVTIRGIRSMDFIATALAEPRISIYQDGVSISRSPGAVTELFDIERVEILKGPQGALFGRSAEVGAIQVIQNKAHNERVGSFHLASGNFDQLEFIGMANAPIIEDKLYGRVAGVYKRRDGYLKNTSSLDLYAVERIAVRGVISFEPTDDARIDLIANYQKDDSVAGSPENSIIPAISGELALGGTASMRVFGPNADQTDFISPREIVDVSLISEWRLTPEWTFTSIFAYRNYESDWFTDEDGSILDLFQATGHRDGEQWSHELRAVYEGAERFSGFVGGGVFYEEPTEGFDLSFDECQLSIFIQIVEDCSLPDLQNAFYEEQSRGRSEYLGLDFFAEIAIDLTPELNFLVDGRWSYEEKRHTFEASPVGRTSFIGGLGIIVQDGTPTNTLILADTTGSDETSSRGAFDGFTWRAAVSWTPASSMSFWASYSRGRRPDFINVEFDGPVFHRVTPAPAETVDSFEVGAKADLVNGRLKVDISSYYYLYENFVSAVFRDNAVKMETTGRATAYGVEAQIIAEPVNDLSVFASYAFNHSTFDDTDKNGNPQDFAGNRFAFSPEHSFAIGAEWISPPFQGWTTRVTPVYSWQSSVSFDDENRPGFGEDGYGLLNVNIEIGPKNAAWRIIASGDNILDKIYRVDGGALSTAFGVPAFYIGPPRLWRIGVSVDF